MKREDHREPDLRRGARPLRREEPRHAQTAASTGRPDGESAFKECANVTVEGAFMNLRYPFWHDHGARAARRRDDRALPRGPLVQRERPRSRTAGSTASRPCASARTSGCAAADIVSPEFGWSTRGIEMEGCTATSEYFMMRSRGLRLRGVRFSGKYSFQYVEDAVIEGCELDTKDALLARPQRRGARLRGAWRVPRLVQPET